MYFEKINIFILDDGIKSKNKKLLNDLASEYCANLEFIKLDKNDIFKNIHGLDRNGKITHTTYARLFIPSLLPNNIDKVLYLDVDSLILDSFKELWKLDLEDNLCAAVIDVSSDKLITNKLGNKLGKLRVCLANPSSESDTICYIAELFRS